MQGDVQTMLRALGSGESDDQFQRAVEFLGSEFETEDYSHIGDFDVYLMWPDRGVTVLVTDDLINSIFFQIRDASGGTTYAEVEQLIAGVTRDTTRAELVSLFGEPVRNGAAYVIFAADGGFVHFEFDDASELRLITVMKELIPSPVAAEEPVAASPKRTALTGQIESLWDAVGCTAYSPQHVSLIVLAGTTMETEDDETEGIKWQYQNFPKTGILLQFKDNVLVGLMVTVHSDEGEVVYPDPANLITGLELPTTRETVTSFMGSPDQSSQHMDLYSLGERYVRFDYHDGLCFSVSITLPGASA